MALIFETENFQVIAEDQPLVDRKDGGHVCIYPRKKISKRQELTPAQAIEMMRLTSVVGEAMETVLTKNGVHIGRINYQDNGNWAVFKPGGPTLHIHLYGRATNATAQPYGQSLYFPHRAEQPEFYDGLQPLTATDVADLAREIERLLKLDKYANANWRL